MKLSPWSKTVTALATLALLAPSAGAQDAAELVERARSALGRDVRIQEGGALRIHGALSYQGTDARYELLFDERGRFLERTAGPVPDVHGYDGRLAWERDWNDSPRVLEFGDRDGMLLRTALWSGRWTEPDVGLVFERVEAERPTLGFRGARGLLAGRIELDPETWLPSVITWSGTGQEQELRLSGWTDRGGFQVPMVVLHKHGLVPDELRVEGVERLDALPDVSPRLEPPADTVFDAARGPALEVKRTRTGHLIVKPAIDEGDLGWFIFDTGAGANVISTHVLELLDAEPFGATTARGMGGQVHAAFLRAERLEVGPMTIANPLFVTMDLEFLSAPLGEEIGGVLGYGLIARCVVEYDFARAGIRLFEPSNYELAGASWGEVFLYGRHPHVRGALEGHEGLFLIDTGNAGNDLLVYHRAVQRLDLLADRETRPGSIGGVGGTVPTRVGLVESLEFAGRRFEAVEANFVTEGRGSTGDPYLDANLGAELLKSMTMVLDYPRKRIAFRHADIGE